MLCYIFSPKLASKINYDKTRIYLFLTYLRNKWSLSNIFLFVKTQIFECQFYMLLWTDDLSASPIKTLYYLVTEINKR